MIVINKIFSIIIIDAAGRPLIMVDDNFCNNRLNIDSELLSCLLSALVQFSIQIGEEIRIIQLNNFCISFFRINEYQINVFSSKKIDSQIRDFLKKIVTINKRDFEEASSTSQVSILDHLKIPLNQWLMLVNESYSVEELISEFKKNLSQIRLKLFDI